MSNRSLAIVFFIVASLLFACQMPQPTNESSQTNTQSSSKKGTLTAGPMLGYMEHFEAMIWVELDKNADVASVEYWPKEDPETKNSIDVNVPHADHLQPVKIIIPDLEQGTTYGYSLSIDGAAVDLGDIPTEFTTRKLWEYREPAPEFKFLFGSCAYINDTQYDRPGDPYGQDNSILATMGQSDADFMIWGGDNIYQREVDWSSESGIRYRYHQVRSYPDIQPLLAKMPHFAIWDDHDYGPNDADISYELKDISLEYFKNYWGNKTYGEPDNPGIYGRFTWGDVEFFLMDNRYHRSPNRLEDEPESTYWGEQQMQWLKNSLVNSRATFKLIINGNQILNDYNRYEGMHHYKTEYNELMEFLVDANVWGVIFMSGDRHHSEIIKKDIPGLYPIHDVTSSPISAKAHDISDSPEFAQPDRIEGSLISVQNYTEVSLVGEWPEREIVFTYFDKTGDQLFEYRINAKELRSPKD